MFLEQLAIMVDDYVNAVRFSGDALDFKLVENSPSLTDDGWPKR